MGGCEGLSRGLLRVGLISLLLVTSSAAASVRLPEIDAKTALRAPQARMLDSATNGTSAPSDGLDMAPTPAPTVYPAASPNSRCSNGFPGVESENGKTCCLAYCLECAGVGCSSRGNASHCCATEIRRQGAECDAAGEAPCFIVPPEPWQPEHTLTYFLYFFVIPFVVVAVLCNRRLLPGCREKVNPDDPANTAHLHGHNTGPGKALSRKPAASAARSKETRGQAEKVEDASGASTL